MLGMPSHTAGPDKPRPHSQPRHWARVAKENPLARFIPFSSLLSAHDVITRGGDYLRTWRLDGVPFECADDHLIAERHEALCSLLRNLAGGQWALWSHRLHRGIGDTMVTSSHDWADLVQRGTLPIESPTVMRTLDDILSEP